MKKSRVFSSYYSERLLEIDPADGEEMQSLSLTTIKTEQSAKPDRL